MKNLKRNTGMYEQLGNLAYFIPDALPPQNPPLFMNDDLIAHYGSAMIQLGKLNEMAQRLPDSTRFIKAYVIKEALLSSAIEEIHTTLVDVFTQPLSDTIRPNKETQLVLNYTKALDRALQMMRQQGLPITSRIILSAHETLMQVGEGDSASPGNYRKQSVRVGNLIPPPAPRIPELIADLEKFINSSDSLPSLIKAGLAHVQFETIHPFLDGNGRIGRLLIVLMLIDSGLLDTPILYPSYYFKKHRSEYYLQLDRVRSHGDFEGWIDYYLRAIESSSQDAYRRVQDIEALEQKIRNQLSPQQGAALSVLFQFPIINVVQLGQHMQKSYNTASKLINQFVDLGILVEMTEEKRNKRYQFASYLTLLEKEYDEV